MTERVISVSRVIPAPPDKIFDLLADPAMHPVLDGSGSVRNSRGGNPSRLSLGAKFGMDMRIGLPYRVTNTVLEFDEPRRIAWRNWGRQVWRYELEQADGGTRVTESFDYARSLARPLLTLLGDGAQKRYTGAMNATLERIERQVTST